METAIIVAIIGAIAMIANNGMNQASARENREFYSEPESYDRLVSMGVNPNVAMQSILGKGQATPVQMPAGNLDGMAEMLKSIVQAPNMQSQINLNSSQSKLFDAQAMYENMRSFYMPLEFEEKKKLNAATIMQLHSNSLMNDKLAKVYENQALTIVPLAQAELSKAAAQTRSLIAQASMFIKQAGVLEAETELVQEQTKGQIIENRIGAVDLTVKMRTQQQQIDIIDATARIQQALATNEEWSAFWKDATSGLGLSNDMMMNLAVLDALGGEYKSFGDDILTGLISNSAQQYDAEMKNMNRNWARHFVQGLTEMPQGFANGFGWAVGSRLVGPSAPPIGGVAASKGAAKSAAKRATSGSFHDVKSSLPTYGSESEYVRKLRTY